VHDNEFHEIGLAHLLIVNPKTLSEIRDFSRFMSEDLELEEWGGIIE